MSPAPELFEIAIVGDLNDREGEITEQLLDVPPGGECVIYFDCPGGNPYAALSLFSLIRVRAVKATAVVTGECSSAALWPFAACERRYVTPLSVSLFHPMRWSSEENVHQVEAVEWARHFGRLEQDMDELLALLFHMPLERIKEWTVPHRYVSGPELVEAGIAEMIDPLKPFDLVAKPARPRRKKKRPKKSS